jgi:hypothetical protein
MREVIKDLGPRLRALGLKGSGQYYRKVAGEWVVVVNLQGSRWGDRFFVNLAAHPVLIPTINDEPVDPKRIKEHDCLLRTRVGQDWSWALRAEEVSDLVSQIERCAIDLVSRAQGLRGAVATELPEALVRNFTVGQTDAFASLHLARAALAFGHVHKAHAIAEWGLEAAGDAVGLRVKLKALLQHGGSAS